MSLSSITALHDPKVQAVNARHGDDHTVNLTKLRALAKRLGTTQTPLARELWATGDGDARLLALLDEISVRMKDAPERLQWAMNWCLGTIGIHHPALRERVLAIGERLEVLKDYPTPPGCVSPYVPLWVAEMVNRQG